MKVPIKTPAELSVMREGGKKLVEVFKIIKSRIKPGVTLKKLDQLALATIYKLDAKPAFLGYQKYPATICTSVNSGIVHCIPDGYQLKTGDLISIDCGLLYRGMYTDAAMTFIVGRDIHQYSQLVELTYQALIVGTQQIKAGVKIGDISGAIEKFILSNKLTIMRQFVGHGIGKKLHEPPVVPNFVGHDRSTVLPAGSTIAIEPIVGLGGEAHTVAGDNWSTHTADNSVVAHFEQTVAVTPAGCEILTPIAEIIANKA